MFNYYAKIGQIIQTCKQLSNENKQLDHVTFVSLNIFEVDEIDLYLQKYWQLPNNLWQEDTWKSKENLSQR